MKTLHRHQRPEVTQAELEAALPETFGRRAVYDAGLYHEQRLAAIDRSGEGPPRTMCGGRVQYDRESFVDWYVERLRTRKKRSA
jgi:hypothetical protein